MSKRLQYINLFINILSMVFCTVNLFLILAPREDVRELRHHLAAWDIWQWKKMSLLSARFHAWLWREGNGGAVDYDERFE